MFMKFLRYVSLAVVELRWAQGGLAHLKDLAAPRNICFERVQGACKRPLEIAR